MYVHECTPTYLLAVYEVCDRHLACMCFFFQAEDGIRDLVRSRGLGDVYKRQVFDPNDPRYWEPRDLEHELRRTFQICHECRMCVTLSLIHI